MTQCITPAQREYIDTYGCPEAITNALTLIEQKLAEPGASEHTHLMLEYDLEYACPSSRYINIIDKNLERRGINWRIHSEHVLVPREVTRTVIRKASLIDLTTPDIEITPWEIEIERVMMAYHRQYNQPLIASPSNLTIFRIPETFNYYWVYTRIFDMWEYNDNYPEAGWKEIP